MKEKLHPFHICLLVFMNQSGVVLFALPRLLAQETGYNGWVTILIYSAMATFNIWLISVLYRLSKGKSIFVIIEQALPKVLVIPLYTFLVSLWTLTGCMVAKQYVIIFQTFVFPSTHPMFIKLLVDVLAFLLISKGIYNIAKAATSFFWILIWTVLLLLYFIKDFEWVNMTPFFFHEHSPNVLVGGLTVYSAFLGYELAILLFPYVEKGKRFIKSVYLANVMVTLSYLAVCVVCFGLYSFNQLKRLSYPVIDLLAQINFPFVERIETFIFSMFLFTNLISITFYIWAAKETVKRVVPKIKGNWITAVLISIAYAVSWIPDVLSKVEEWLKYLGIMEIIIAFGLPLLLIVILWLSKGEKESCTTDYD